MSNIPAIVTLGAAVILPAALKRQFYDEAESQWGASLKNDWNNEGDAFRHAYVTARFSQYFGTGTAVALGDVNELSDTASKPKDKAMDRFNNRVGANIGSKYKPYDTNAPAKIASDIREAIKPGRVGKRVLVFPPITTIAAPIPRGQTIKPFVHPTRLGEKSMTQTNSITDSADGVKRNPAEFKQTSDYGLWSSSRIGLLNSIFLFAIFFSQQTPAGENMQHQKHILDLGSEIEGLLIEYGTCKVNCGGRIFFVSPATDGIAIQTYGVTDSKVLSAISSRATRFFYENRIGIKITNFRQTKDEDLRSLFISERPIFTIQMKGK